MLERQKYTGLYERLVTNYGLDENQPPGVWEALAYLATYACHPEGADQDLGENLTPIVNPSDAALIVDEFERSDKGDTHVTMIRSLYGDDRETDEAINAFVSMMVSLRQVRGGTDLANG